MEKSRIKGILTEVKTLTGNYGFKHGMCEIVGNLYITGKINHFEHLFIIQYLMKNIPTPDNDYQEFTKVKTWRNPTQPHEFWWDSMQYSMETRLFRIAYLTKLINNIK